MYLSHYKLRKKPFDISPDPRFLWFGEKHREGLATLKYGILANKGFLMITGDVGTGKTALIRTVESEVQAHLIVITIPDPSLSLMDFYNFMAFELGMERTFQNKGEFLIGFKRLILKAASTHRRVLMIIDEAHRLSSELLEEIRLLSNIDLGGQILLNTFFVGQLEFKALVSRPENRAVRQRITVSYELQPLTLTETQDYITHRLRVSGATRPIFTPEAVQRVYAASRGYPRLINIICDHALISGFGSGAESIGPDTIDECGKDLMVTIGRSPLNEEAPAAPALERPALTRPPPAKLPPLPSPMREDLRRAGVLAGAAAVLVAAWFYGGDWIEAELSRWIGKRDHYLSQSANQASVRTADERTASVVGAEQAGSGAESDARPEPQPPAQAASATAGAEQSGSLAPVAADRPTSMAQAPVMPPPLTSPVAPQPAPQAAAPPPRVSPEPFGLKEFTILFTKNSAEVEPHAREILLTAASLLKSFPDTRAVIEGHTDSFGDAAYNRLVSERRAGAVRDYFTGHGIEAPRLTVYALGADKPADTNSTAEGRSNNRRVAVRIVGVKPK